MAKSVVNASLLEDKRRRQRKNAESRDFCLYFALSRLGFAIFARNDSDSRRFRTLVRCRTFFIPFIISSLI